MLKICTRFNISSPYMKTLKINVDNNSILLVYLTIQKRECVNSRN